MRAKVADYSQRMPAFGSAAFEPSPPPVDPFDQAMAWARERLGMVEALIKGIEHHHEVADVTMDAPDRQTARKRICETLEVSEMAAEYVLDMTTSRLTKAGRREYEEELERLRTRLDHLVAQGREAYVAEWRVKTTIETHAWITKEVEKKLKRRVKKYAEHPTTHDPMRIKIDEVRIDDRTLVVELHDDNLPDHLYALRIPLPDMEVDFSNEMYEQFEDFIKRNLAEIQRLITVDGLPILEPPPPVITINFP
jgi:DNA gyrase/topoisomerase IV subunit A